MLKIPEKPFRSRFLFCCRADAPAPQANTKGLYFSMDAVNFDPAHARGTSVYLITGSRFISLREVGYLIAAHRQ